MRAADLVVIGIYLLALLAIGVWFARRQTSTQEYFVAGRSVPGWAMGLSLLATIITSVTFVAYPGAAYAGDWSLLVPGIMFVGVLCLIGRIVVPFFRHAVNMSAFEYFGLRFGTGIRMYSALVFGVGHFAKMGFVFYLLALTLASMTGWAIGQVIMVTAAVTICYTVVGGMEAVVWTDVVQGFVLWLGILVSLGYLLFLPPQGPGAVLRDAWTHHKMSLGSTALRLDQPTILVLAIYGFFFYLQKYTADQTVVQRYLIARSDRSALRGIALGAGLCLPVWTGFMLIGSLLWSFYHLTGERLPPDISKADQVFPHFLVTHLAPGMGGLFVAALAGSAMAMLASDMNCLAVIGTEDFFRFARPHATDGQRLMVARGIVVLSGCAAAALAVQLAHTRGTALSLYYDITAIVAGGLAGLFLLAFLFRRATRGGAIAGVLANLAFTLWATATLHHQAGWAGPFRFPWQEYMVGAVGHVVLLAVGVLFSYLLPGCAPQAPDKTLWGWLSQFGFRSFSITATQPNLHPSSERP
jgi:solute:Na+ symporter, SSS family